LGFKNCNILDRVGKKGILPGIEIVAAIREMKRPQCKRVVKSFLGLESYYRKFVKNFAVIARPLYDLEKSNVIFQWKKREKHAFQTLKETLVNPPILKLNNLELPYILDVD
jgi:hypothetical protein